MIFCAWIFLSLEWVGAEKRRNSNSSSGADSCGCCGSSGSGCASASASADALGVCVGFDGKGSGGGMGPYRAARRECSAEARVGSAAGSGEEDGEREV
jgi:hypothetical protein